MQSTDQFAVVSLRQRQLRLTRAVKRHPRAFRAAACLFLVLQISECRHATSAAAARALLLPP